MIAKNEAAYLQPAWRHGRAPPAEYLWGRIRLTASILGLSRQPIDAYLGVARPDNFGRPIEFTAATTRPDYSTVRRPQRPTIPLDYQWPYLLAVGLPEFLWRRRPGRPAAAAGDHDRQWVNIVVDFFFAPASSYTYAELDVPLTIVLGAVGDRRARGARAAPSPPQ